MNQLPELYRLPVSLRFCENLSYKEISEILDRPEKTVQIQVTRGLDKIKSSITAAGLRMASVAITSALVTLKLEAAPESLKATVARNTLGEVARNSSLQGTAANLPQNLMPTLTFGKLVLGVVVLVASTATILTLISKPTGEGPFSKPSSIMEQKTSYHWSFENPASKEVFQVLKGSWESVQKKGVNGSNCMLSSREDFALKINMPLSGKPLHLSFQARISKKGKKMIRLPTLELFTQIFIQHKEATPNVSVWNRFDIYFNEKSSLIKINGKPFFFSLLQPKKRDRLLLMASGMWLLDDLHIEDLSPNEELQFTPYLELVHEHFEDLSPSPTRFEIKIHDTKKTVYVYRPTASEVIL